MKSSITALTTGLFLSLLLASGPLLAATLLRMQPITVSVLPGTDPSVLDDLVNVRAVKDKAPAVLQLDLAHKRVLDGRGQTVVEFTTGKPISLQGTVDKWRYAAAFSRMATSQKQEIYIDWGSLPQRGGPTPFLYDREEVDLVMTHVSPGRQLVVFAFDASGTINLLYFNGSNAGDVIGDTVQVGVVASAPFGVDHIVAVSANEPRRMVELTNWLIETANARGMLDSQGSILEQISTLRDVRVGFLSLYTCRVKSCGR